MKLSQYFHADVNISVSISEDVDPGMSRITTYVYISNKL